jgi:hypothetical protein
VEDEETLKSGTLIGQLTDPIENQINQFLPDGVMATSVVVGSIFLAGYELLGMEELAVSPSTDLIYNSWLQVDKDGTRNVFTSTSFAEESVERIITSSDGLI